MHDHDVALQDRVHLAVHKSPYVNSRNLRFESSQGRVTIRGNVSSYYQKQMAQELVRQLDGVSAIENQLVVNWA